MQEQLSLLRLLQQLDDQLRDLHGEQKRLPLQLQAPEQALHQAQERCAAIQDEIRQEERQQRALERESEQSHAALEKMQNKLRDVKTNKEYEAVLSEITMGKERLGALEDRTLQTMEVLEQRRQAQRVQEQAIEQAQQALLVCRQTMQQAHATLAAHILTLEEQRQQTTIRLSSQFLVLYEKVASQHNGRAIAALYEGACGGCHLKVQPQLVSEIRQQLSLYTCPHCRLLLLWPA